MSESLDFEHDGGGWPLRETSRLVKAAGFHWHVQIVGQGPVVLLLHGTGSSCHSYHRLMPLLKDRFTVVAPDLPGHAFTDNPGAARLTLPDMASATGEVLKVLNLKPLLVVGHSAGAAIAIRAALDGGLVPRAIVSLNGALLPLTGVVGGFFSPLAKLLVSQSWVPRLLAWRAGNRDAVAGVLRDTGSKLEESDIDLYARLFQSGDHVAATLAMMANWDLAALERDLPKLDVPLILVAASNDKTISPGDASRVAKLVKGARVHSIAGLGHLAHEERPASVAEIIDNAAVEFGPQHP